MQNKAFLQYIETALWSSVDDDGNPLDSQYSFEDFDKDTINMMQNELDLFLNEVSELGLELEQDDTDLAHDFWLTRNRHGAGFWDGDYPNGGDQLTKLAHKYGACDLYINDDGLVYAS